VIVHVIHRDTKTTDINNGACVSCLTNDDCSENTPICNSETNTCQACSSDLDCANFVGKTKCSIKGLCVIPNIILSYGCVKLVHAGDHYFNSTDGQNSAETCFSECLNLDPTYKFFITSYSQE
jgi:hypothetical protein